MMKERTLIIAVALTILCLLLVALGMVLWRQQQLEATNVQLQQTIQALSNAARQPAQATMVAPPSVEPSSVWPSPTATPDRTPAELQPAANITEGNALEPDNTPTLRSVSIPTDTVQSTTPSVESVSSPTSTPVMLPSATATRTPAQISAEQAADIAISYVGGGSVAGIDMENEHGSVVYEVSFHGGSQVYVDALSGQVVYAKVRQAPTARPTEHREHTRPPQREQEPDHHRPPPPPPPDEYEYDDDEYDDDEYDDDEYDDDEYDDDEYDDD
jgi:hypothetical protein